MINISADKVWYKKKSFVLLLFCCVTLVMLITRYFSFYTFKGSDDLHYAFLSSQVLNSSYDVFFAQDIYAGRPMVIFYQALWFKIFGINDFSMLMPSISILIALAYVVCFKSGLQKNAGTVTLAAALVYFNPVTTRTTTGNLPDVYIALIALLVFLMIKKSTREISKRQSFQNGMLAGLLLVAGLFVKESIVLIYAGAAVVLFYQRKKISRNFFMPLVAAVFAGVVGYLFFYYLNTGDALYHFVQIKDAAYFNPCSYGCFSNSYLIKRLTITVPYEAIVSGAWPLLLAAPLLFIYRNKDTAARFWKISFVVLLLLAMYFPFSLSPYVPLCHDMRQFFFIFPFAIVWYLAAFSTANQTESSMKTINIGSLVVFAATTFICLFFTPYNKWGIMCSGLLMIAFCIIAFGNKKIQTVILYLLVTVIFWLSTAYTSFKKPHTGYADLRTLSGSIQKDSSFRSDIYYFLNNDTKTHFALINQFDTSKQFVNLDTTQKGFKPFISYQSRSVLTDTEKMQPGWLVVSGDYLENLDTATTRFVKLLLAQHTPAYTTGHSTAYRITTGEMLQQIIPLVNIKSSGNGCY